MGTIVYSSLVELLLKEGNKTKEEIYQEAINRFGFPEDGLGYNIQLGLSLNEASGHILKTENGKYHLLKLTEGFSSVKNFLGFLNKAPEDYLKERPHIKKLKQALEEVY